MSVKATIFGSQRIVWKCKVYSLKILSSRTVKTTNDNVFLDFGELDNKFDCGP